MVGSSLLRNAPAGATTLTIDRSEFDLKDHDAVLSYLKYHSPDAVFLAAAKVGGILANLNNYKDFLVENLEIQNSVIMSASRAMVPNLVFLGSSCVYPRLAKQPIKEESLLSGPLELTNEGYAIAKIAGIKLTKAIHEETGYNYLSLMPTNLYGPNDNFDPVKSHVPAALMRKFHEAKIFSSSEVLVWGSGFPRREFMHVDDMARACWYMLDQNAGGELINIGTGEDLAIAEFAELMAKVVGYNGKITYDTSKPDGTPRKLLDVSKAHSFGWKHRIELEDGLRQTYTWYVDAISRGGVRGQ